MKGTRCLPFVETSVNSSSMRSITTRLAMTLIPTIVGIGCVAIVSSIKDLASYLVNFGTLIDKSTGTSDIHALTLGVASATQHYAITPFEGGTKQI
jgi:hypothetical protein